jgi:hypothetical protein
MYPIGKLSISHLPAVLFDGVYRVLACHPETEESVAAFPRFGTQMATRLDPSQWQEIDLQWYKNPIWDQGMTSSCVGQGTTAGIQICYMQSGRPLTEFNPYFVYGLINGGRDAGAMISDGLKALMQFGTCFKNDLQPGVMFRNQFPQQAFNNAKRFRLAQAYKCGNFEDICSAITLGFVCPLGIYVDQGFSRLDNEGVAGTPSSNQGGGHCILGMGLKKSSRFGWLIKIQNSWGTRFGINGYAYIHKGHFQRMNPDAFAIQSVMDDPQDNSPADEVPVVTN